MEEWKEYKAIDFCSGVTDGTHDSPKPKEEGFYLITSKHLKNNGIDFSNANKISEEDYFKIIQRSKVEKFDVLYSMIGTIGNICQVIDEKIDFAVKNMGIFKMGGDCLKSKWLYYWLKSPFAKEYVNSRLAGSTQSYMTLNSLREFPILVPEKTKMSKIVSILSSLDDKIEVNRRINEQLEELAQALFKSWFVDFEPFKEQPFVETELGMIPEGWKVGNLGDIGEVVGGATPSKANPEYYVQNGISWITPKDLSINKNKFIDKGETDITELGYSKCSAKIMPKGAVLFSSRAPIGYIAIAKKELCTNQGFKSIVPKLAGTAFIYFYLKNNVSNIESMSSGSTFKEASGSLMKSLRVIVPPVKLLQMFEEKVSSIFDKQEFLEEEILHLTTLRDTLLPKLMSGEIKV